MIAPWPQADVARQNAEIEARFARFQEVLRAVRDIRNRQNVPPRKQIDFAVRCDAATAELLKPMEPYFVSMAAARPTGWGPEVAAPKLSANVALAGMEVFVDLADLIDVGAEVERNEAGDGPSRRPHRREAQEAGKRQLRPACSGRRGGRRTGGTEGS